jgi:hypothetical protein
MKIILLFFLLYPALYFLVLYRQDSIPTHDPLNNFSIDQAYQRLIELTHEQQGIGERLFSSKKCHDAHLYLLNQLNSLKQQHSNEHVDFLIDQENVSSEMFQQMLTYSGMRRYLNVTNVIALLLPKNETFHNEVVLVNSHFDSRVSSPGAFDDGVPVAIMLEHIRNIMNETSLKHPILFLFNGAEEVGLFGAHAFMQHSRHARSIKAFVNLEAAGFGGRDFLFQTTNGWITKLYAKIIPHPTGNAVAQDVFQSGIVPSDTDYRYFYQYRKQSVMHGIDSAFIKNGQWYHSYLDSLTTNGMSEQDKKASLQFMADNSGTIIRYLGLMEHPFDTNSVESHSRSSYFDVLNFFMVAYDVESAKPFYFGIVTLAFTLVLIQYARRKLTLFSMIVSLIVTAIVLIAGLVSSIGVAHLLIKTNKHLSWYAVSADIAFLLYAAPAIAGSLLTLYIINLATSKLLSKESMYGAALIMWSVALIAGAKYNLGSSYLFVIVLLTLIVGFLFEWVPVLQMLVVLTLPAINYLSLGNAFTVSFSGMLGRSGSKPVDYTMAVLVGLTGSLLTVISLPFLFNKQSNDKRQNKGLSVSGLSIVLVLAIAVALVYISSNVLEPYSVLQPKRFNLRHVLIYDNDKIAKSYLNIRSTDPIPPEYVFNKIGHLDHGFNYTTDVKTSLVSNVESRNPDDPVFYKEITEAVDAELYRSNIQVDTTEQVDSTRVSVTIFSSKHLFHQHVYVRAKKGDVKKWSFASSEPSFDEKVAAYKWDTVVGYARFNTEEENENQPKIQTFWFDIMKGQEKTLQIHVVSHFLDKQVWTDSIRQLVAKLPNWTTTVPVVTSEQTYTIAE